MKLTERLSQVAKEAAAIRNSLTFHDPNKKEFNTDFALERGERRIQGGTGSDWNRRVLEAATLFKDVYSGARPDWHMKEAMTTSDFPLLFGDLLYRQLLGNYMPYPVSYPQYFRIYDLADFRKLHLYTIDGGQGILDVVPQGAPYPETKFVEGEYDISVVKYGRRYGINFEMVVNDDLNAFQQRPALMALGARRSEEFLATTQMMDVNGPHASFFTSGNKNIVTGNPPLSIQGLQTAFRVLKAQKDKDGQPIVIEAATLVVPPALEITANNILHALQLRINAESGGGTSDQFLYAANWMSAKVKLSVNPYFPYIGTASSGDGVVGDDSWMLVANPNDMNQRPAFMFGFLRGRRQPQLFIKSPNQMMLGGGNADPMDGDFDTDSIDYKLRHIFGAAQGDPKMAVSSDGSGS
jgi:hypothetical protein